jgi:plasmid stabilization system protein ParE
MKHREVRLTEDATKDLDKAAQFYEGIETGLGTYFFNAILNDLEALEFFGGLHQQRFGYYACPAKRFPFFIYYDLNESTVDVVAILDTRENPATTGHRFEV